MLNYLKTSTYFALLVIVLYGQFQEVIRIKNEHPDDNNCIVNDRVKGRLKVTRAFGAGFLKQVCFPPQPLWYFTMRAY